jgi:hypothetical protein
LARQNVIALRGTFKVRESRDQTQAWIASSRAVSLNLI